jgi:hypothetical protein
MKRPQNIDLGKASITDQVRVSSAAIYSEAHFGNYWQVETWIFSNDPRQRSTQVIHGTCHYCASVNGGLPSRHLCDQARKVHGYITANMLAKLSKKEPA